MILSRSIAMNTARLTTTIASTTSRPPTERRRTARPSGRQAREQVRRRSPGTWTRRRRHRSRARRTSAWRSVRNDGGLRARPGSAAASSTNDSASDATTFTMTIAPITMTGTITAIDRDRSRKARQPALQPVRDRRQTRGTTQEARQVTGQHGEEDVGLAAACPAWLPTRRRSSPTSRLVRRQGIHVDVVGTFHSIVEDLLSGLATHGRAVRWRRCRRSVRSSTRSSSSAWRSSWPSTGTRSCGSVWTSRRRTSATTRCSSGERRVRGGRFIRSQLVLGALYGIWAFLVSLLFGLPFGPATAFLSGLIMAIPIYGPYVSWLPPVLVALWSDPSRDHRRGRHAGRLVHRREHPRPARPRGRPRAPSDRRDVRVPARRAAGRRDRGDRRHPARGGRPGVRRQVPRGVPRDAAGRVPRTMSADRPGRPRPSPGWHHYRRATEWRRR